MSVSRSLVAAAVVSLAALVLALGAKGVPAAPSGQQRPPAWEQALMVRSRALDRRDHLGSFANSKAGPAWLRALELRSIGLDRVNHLGSFVPPPPLTTTDPRCFVDNALEARTPPGPRFC